MDLGQRIIEIVDYRTSETRDEKVIDFILSIQKKDFAISCNVKDRADLFDVLNFCRQGRSNFWVAIHDHEFVGTIALLDIGGEQAVLRKMFVKKEFYDVPYSIGQHLLDTLLYWARANQFKKIWLGTTRGFARARRFYERNGFIKISKADLPTQFPIMALDKMFYTKGVNGFQNRLNVL